MSVGSIGTTRGRDMSMLSRLIGETVRDVSDDLSTFLPLNAPVPFPESGQVMITREITFTSYQLSISNPVQLTKDGVAVDKLAVLRGLTVLSTEEHASTATIRFTADVVLQIDLREESFTGPEAMVLQGPNGLIVVWN